ncbi:hypothetical protein [uncultured Aliiroseovarius sp.]|uniref:hypothetical protein n=1 Tax=uncultured Aliiroseovarius sp. TaxID=1658783 RepID=UPI00261F4E92|nr:hypothetical protein [uncultured Aliiroseovarius sp.]
MFYSHHNTTLEPRRINPEPGTPFALPAVPWALAVKELTHGPALDDRRIDALVAFMKTLADVRYEYLLEE